MQKGFVYLINDWEHNGIYKIGVTRGTIEHQLKKLQTGNPDDLVVCRYFHTEHPFFIEKQLHRRYSGFRVRDEWFELSDEEALKFPETCRQIEEMIDIMKDNPFFPKNVK